MAFGARRIPLLYKRSVEVGGADAILLETGDALLLEAGTDVLLNTSIPAASEASTLDGTEWTVIVQGGTTKKVRTARIAEYING